MNEFKIIGVAGAARAGKDTIGDYLCKKYNFTPISFAAPIKQMVAALLNVSEEWLEENKETMIYDTGATPRKLFQTLGTEWGRTLIAPNLWINIASNKIDQIIETGNHPDIVITDVRFDNEAEWIRGNNGIICHVNRNDALKVRDHPSEAGVTLKGNDFIIHNDFSLRNLEDLVDAMIEMYPTLIKLGERNG